MGLLDIAIAMMTIGCFVGITGMAIYKNRFKKLASVLGQIIEKLQDLERLSSKHSRKIALFEEYDKNDHLTLPRLEKRLESIEMSLATITFGITETDRSIERDEPSPRRPKIQKDKDAIRNAEEIEVSKQNQPLPKAREKILTDHFEEKLKRIEKNLSIKRKNYFSQQLRAQDESLPDFLPDPIEEALKHLDRFRK